MADNGRAHKGNQSKTSSLRRLTIETDTDRLENMHTFFDGRQQKTMLSEWYAPIVFIWLSFLWNRTQWRCIKCSRLKSAPRRPAIYGHLINLLSIKYVFKITSRSLQRYWRLYFHDSFYWWFVCHFIQVDALLNEVTTWMMWTTVCSWYVQLISANRQMIEAPFLTPMNWD